MTETTTAGAIDLTTEVERTTVRIERDGNPLASLTSDERMRLFIRVLCELVAYGELDDELLPPRS